MFKSKPGLIFISILLAILLPRLASSLELKKIGFHDRHFIGGRIGLHTSTSDETPPDNPGYSQNFSKNTVYAEFFYAYRLARPLAIELSLGIYSRGDIKYSSGDGIIVQPVFLYPIWLSAKLYPFYRFKTPFHTFIQVGGGLVYGRHELIGLSPGGFVIFVDQENEVKFSYMLGTGIDWPIGDRFAITAGFKYLPAKFGNLLAGVEDYTGWTLTVGVGYMLGK